MGARASLLKGASRELVDKLIQYKIYDEKMTSHFVSLTKIRGQDVTISDICDKNEIPFVNPASRSEYIKKNFWGPIQKTK
jgi:hypothetical protein